ncbi:bifunctional 5,10-methylenetetrahydrofolate dehydrogenase/5,10-methenyltetrahydrofolate cyclohydrolase [Candidatus Gracilibacteria bacterium 28_42_T64]|nr:bifunctional 5,10-methylenetetrahydrofolate dehydrogenase/5,10-methenyltetrahydrofolate cyclohydrolase [Candidatus Gracilibacteria bacterium 28_42_T64]
MIIDGKQIASNIYEEIKKEVSGMKTKPTLGVILVGENSPSLRYINEKKKWAEYLGINFELKIFKDNITEEEILSQIEYFNNNESISGYMVQLPLPNHINEKKLIASISPKKDVDGFHPENVGKVLIGDTSGFVSCTPAGIMNIFKSIGENLEGKVVTVIGKSNIVGKPLVALLMNAGATVISCNSKTKNTSEHTLRSDIVIVATGIPQLLKENMLKKGSTIIDVGFTVIDGKIHGDTDFENIEKAGHTITPVPGGVGALTVAMLMSNTLQAEQLK